MNNTVKYASPEFAGFSFGGTYSFSNDTGFARNRQWSVGAQYEQGGLLIGAAFLNANDPGASSGGAIAASGSVGADANFASARLRIFGAGINYTAGPATVGSPTRTATSRGQPRTSAICSATRRSSR